MNNLYVMNGRRLFPWLFAGTAVLLAAWASLIHLHRPAGVRLTPATMTFDGDHVVVTTQAVNHTDTAQMVRVRLGIGHWQFSEAEGKEKFVAQAEKETAEMVSPNMETTLTCEFPVLKEDRQHIPMAAQATILPGK